MNKQQAEKKTVKFETEVSKLLDIVANSLYTEKEIFLRELVSNSSDACEKLRYVSQTDSKAAKTNKFEIKIHINEKNNTISVKDNGIGMDEKDMQSNLGTIAKSGTEDFIKKMGDKKGDINQIGKFGVGFYSSFMVSDQVVVRSKKYDSSNGYLWTSDGKGTFSIEETEYNEIGTEITLSIKKDENEFLSKYKIEEIIKKYSDFVPFPIFVTSEDDKKEKKKDEKPEEQVNSAEAIWLKEKSKIKKDDYKSFYNQVSSYYDEPLTTIHFKAEGVVNYTALLYLPKTQPQDLYHPDRKNKLKLYVNKIFISDKSYFEEIKKNKIFSSFPLIRSGYKKDLVSLTNYLGISNHSETENEWVRTKVVDNSIFWEGINSKSFLIPTVVGMTLKDAIFLLESRGLKVNYKGRGRVKKQNIGPGNLTKKYKTISINLG